MRLMVLLTVLFTAWSGPACAADSAEVTSRLQVRGEAVLEVPADEVRLSIGVRSTGSSAQAVLDANSRTLRRVEQALLEAGLETSEVSTGRFSLQPEWSPRPRGAEADWTPEIVGYTVTNTLQLRSTKLDRIGAWIAVANRAGANEIGQLIFGLADPRRHREAAIRQATRHAEADARALAEAAGVSLVRILELQLDPASPSVGRHADSMVRAMAVETAPPISAPDDLQVRAGVAVTWLIGD